MFSSTIIPTIARPTLTRTVQSVLEQTLDDDFEVIVVNDSGQPLPKAAWQQSERVQVVNTNRRERSVARNTGAAIARGKYLHFLDDDDWLLPDALQAFKELAARNKEAAWLYGSSQLVDRQGSVLIVLDNGLTGNCFVQVMAGEWIPLQASLIEASTFFAVRGFNPRVAATEDVDLCRRIALFGYFQATPTVVACIGMGPEGSTTDLANSQAARWWAREQILEMPGVFSRLRSSAKGSLWLGRIARIYLTSGLWNLQNKRILTASSRATSALLSFVMSGPHVFSKTFRRSVLNSYQSVTFARALRESHHRLQNKNIASQ